MNPESWEEERPKGNSVLFQNNNITIMIPKIIHFCWVGGDEYPPLVLKCINSWKTKLPDYEIMLWDRTRFDVNSTHWTKEAFEQKKYAFVADYIRLYALNKYGGIYLDSDVEVLKSFDDLLSNKSFIGYDSTEAIEAAIIGAEPSINWVKTALNYYNDRHFILANGKLDTRPIPRMIGNVLDNTYKISSLSKNEIMNFNDISIFPSIYFSPKNYQTHNLKKSSKTYCIHHFDGKWIDNSINNRIKSVFHNLIYKIGGDKFHNIVVQNVRKLKK